MNEPNPELIKDFSEARKLTSEKKYHESIKRYEIILKKYPNLVTAIYTMKYLTNDFLVS